MQELAYQTIGDSDKPALLLLHGFMSSRHQWLANLPLSESYRLVLVELWGHGKSPEPENTGAYSVATYIEQFERIRQKLSIDTWGVVGQSYGAGLVLNYALTHPEVCPAVVVTNSRSAFGDVQRAARRSATTNRPDSPRDLPLHPINARRFPQEVKDALVRDADAMTMTTIANSGRLAPELGFTEKLAQLEQPVLLTNGMYEKIFQPSVALLRRDYPHIDIVDLEGGHSINIEDASGFNRVVGEFFARHL